MKLEDINWADVPSRYRYAAQDRDGSIWFFVDEPTLDAHGAYDVPSGGDWDVMEYEYTVEPTCMERPE